MAGVCRCGNEPSGTVKWCGVGADFLTSCRTVSFSRRALPHIVIYVTQDGVRRDYIQ